EWRVAARRPRNPCRLPYPPLQANHMTCSRKPASGFRKNTIGWALPLMRLGRQFSAMSAFLRVGEEDRCNPHPGPVPLRRRCGVAEGRPRDFRFRAHQCEHSGTFEPTAIARGHGQSGQLPFGEILQVAAGLTAWRLRGTARAMAKDDGQAMWGGRFGAKPAELMTRINASIRFDRRLWREDIAASKAHAAMLRDQRIIAEADAASILAGLDRIAAEYERDGVPEREELEDIHMTVEHRLPELIGEAAGRLHTARSRNDQVATDFKLWVRGACDEASQAIRGLQRALVERAEEHAD